MNSVSLKDLMVLAILALLSAGIGFGIDQVRGKPIGLSYAKPSQRLVDASEFGKSASGEEIASHASISGEIQIINLAQLTELLKKKGTLVLDVRPSIFFKLGRIPGSTSMPEKDFEKNFKDSKHLIEAAFAMRSKIVIYCSGSHCSDASKVAKKLSELGYGNLLIFEGGMEAWLEAGFDKEQEEL